MPLVSDVTSGDKPIDPIKHFTPDDHRYFEERRIDIDFAYECGVRRLGHEELIELGFRGLKNVMLSGIVFPCRNPFTGVQTAGVWRPDPECGLEAKYMRAKDHRGTPRNRTVFFAPSKAKNPAIFICESPAKAIALQQALDEERVNGLCIGLNGVNGGWFSPKEMVPTRDGAMREKRGLPRLVEDLADMDWHRTKVWIVFDNDANTHKHAEQRKEKKGVVWAEEKLCELIRSRGGSVMLANFPYRGEKLGVDDMLHRHGTKPIVDFILNRSIPNRNVQAILQAPEGGRLTPQTAASLYGEQVERPAEILEPRLIERECVYLVSAPEKFGKSILATNLIACVESGKPFLGQFHVKQRVRSLYVSYEMPKHAIKERFEGTGVVDSMYLDAMELVDPVTGRPKEWCLNPNRSGFKGIHEIPENKANLAELEAMVKDNNLGLVVIDPLIDAIDASPNDEICARGTIRAFRALARRCKCAVVVIHHTRKRSREGGSNGSDESAGSGNWMRKVDGGITCERVREKTLYRRRIHFTMRYSDPEDLELFPGDMKQGDYSMTAQPWKSHMSVWDERIGRVFDEWEPGDEVSTKEVAQQLELGDVQASKLMKKLISQGKGKKVKNGLYVLSGGSEEAKTYDD